MEDHQTFCRIMDQACVTAAAAVSRYAEVSGVDPVRIFLPAEPKKPRGSMDEHFLPSFVFDHLRRTSQIEALTMRLWPTLESLGGARGDNRKPDLAIYHPEHGSRVLALIEFKPHCGEVDSARAELLMRMEAIECPFGAVCAMHADGPAAYLPTLKERAAAAGDTWHCAEAKLPSGVSTTFRNHYVFARGLRCPQDHLNRLP